MSNRATASQIMMLNFVTQGPATFGGKKSPTLGGQGRPSAATSCPLTVSSSVVLELQIGTSWWSCAESPNDQVDRPGGAQHHACHDADARRQTKEPVRQPPEESPPADTGDQVTHHRTRDALRRTRVGWVGVTVIGHDVANDVSPDSRGCEVPPTLPLGAGRTGRRISRMSRYSDRWRLVAWEWGKV